LRQQVLTPQSPTAYANGGAVAVVEAAYFALNSSILVNNMAISPQRAVGGGLYSHITTAIYVSDCTFRKNSALARGSQAIEARGGGSSLETKSGYPDVYYLRTVRGCMRTYGRW
jgi:hypothetical protein